jgi:predicted DsbA family dithiol-disulfide isomerase
MADPIPAGEACGPEGCAVPAEAAGAPALAAAPASVSRIDVISDAICPWCWVGKRNLEGALDLLAAEGEAFEVQWHPFQLNPEMPREGVDRASYRAQKFGSEARSREADARVAEAGAAAGLAFRHDLMRRTPNTVDAHRLIHLAGVVGLQDQVVEALFRGYFAEGRDVGDHATLAELAAGAGMARDEVLEYLGSGAMEQEVRQEDEYFRRHGLSGVPTFALDGHVVFSGAMPAEQMAEAFRRALRVLRERAKAA